METIITINVNEINLSSQFLRLTTPKGELEIDIKKMLQEPLNSDNAYFNATQIAKMYGVRTIDYFRSDRYLKYETSMKKALKVRFKSEKIPPLKKTIRGRHHSGTWLHSKMIIDFIKWVDIDFAVQMDLFIQDLIVRSNELKIERENTKTLFQPLTNTIKEFYIPNQTSDKAKQYAYSSLLTLANIKVLGCSAKKYAKDNNIEIEKGKTIRDYLNKDMLEKIKEVEQDINGMIKYGKMYDYQQIKKELNV